MSALDYKKMQNFISRIGQGGGGGGGGDAGAGEMWGIDTSRVLKDATTVTSSAPFTYTATENCWVRVNSSVQNGATMLVYIDNVPLGRGYSASSMIQWMNIFPLLKGQILRVTTTYDGLPGNVVIYGSKTASGESGSGGHIYSTEERVIGKWLDNKDLFEKSFRVRTGNANLTTFNTGLNMDFAAISEAYLYTSGNTLTNGFYNGIGNFFSVYCRNKSHSQPNTLAIYCDSYYYNCAVDIVLHYTKA